MPIEPGRPGLSVVVPSVNGWGDLQGCLEALSTDSAEVDLEILVADRVGDTVRIPLRHHYPHVRLLEAPPGTTIPALRAMAFRAARADVIGVIEDHVIVPANWARQMLETHEAGAYVVGGSIENAARDRLVDWAAFLCEYSHCIDPGAPGPTAWVMGNNVTYRRDLLERFRDTIEQGRWEDALHDAMVRAGIPLESRPDIRVGHKKHYTVTEYLAQRYFYARSYAAMRLADTARWRRILYGFAATGLPPVLLYRIVKRVWRTHRHRRELVLSLPLLAPFVTAWAGGEIVGSWLGPGDALAKVC